MYLKKKYLIYLQKFKFIYLLRLSKQKLQILKIQNRKSQYK